MSGGHHVVTCVIAAGGDTTGFLQRLADDKGIWSFVFSKARHAVVDHAGRRPRLVQAIEKDEITILVPDQRLSEIFDYCREVLRVDEPGRGVIYVQKTGRAAELIHAAPA